MIGRDKDNINKTQIWTRINKQYQHKTLKVSRTLVPSSILTALCILVVFLDTQIYSLYRSHLNRGLIDYAVNEAFGEIMRVGMSAVTPSVVAVSLLSLIIYFLFNFI